MDKVLRLSRQADIIPPVEHYSVAVIGAGGIGSNVVHLLASVGFSDVSILDPDSVGEENIFPGFFGQSDLELEKAHCLADEIDSKYGLLYDSRVGTHRDMPMKSFDIMIVSPDTLAARQEIWNMVGKSQCSQLYIDARMGGVLATVYGVDMRNGAHRTAYESDLFLDRIEGDLPCGEKATAPLTKGFIPGMIGRVLVEFANQRPVPFMQRIDLLLGQFMSLQPALESEV